MDLSTVFKVMNYIVMVLGGIVILIAVITVAGLGIATSGTDQITQGGVTFFATLILLPAIAQGIIGVLAGRAGLQSDPDRCRKCSRILAALAVWSLVSALRTDSANIITFLNLAIYGFYCYLAHTQYY
jgi:hypothetical protein